MEGYDTILLGNFYAYPAFAKQFGKWNPSTQNYPVSASWQAGLGQSSGVGAFFGALLNGVLVDLFGQKRVLLVSLIALTAFLFIVFFSTDVQVLLIGELFCGFPWGIFATTSPAYASEVLPLSLRVYLTSWTNMCFITGQLIAAGVLAGLVGNPTKWAYKIPFAIQWLWPLVLFPVLLFAPESPWYLVRKGRIQEARRSLVRLNRSDTDAKTIDAILSLIIHTDNQEKEMLKAKAKTSYWQCFRGVDLRRTEIACMCFAGQILTGLSFAYNSTYFFQQVGLTTNQTYQLNVGDTALALFGAILNWVIVMPYFGRRTIYLWGCGFMTIVLFLIGVLNVHTSEKQFGMTQAVLTIIWTMAFQLSVGQLGWALPAEIGSTRLRQKTVVLARNAYYIASVIAGVLEPYFINPTAWNLKGYTSLVWAATCFITLVWAFFRLPETKGRSYEEINLLFAKRVGARHFKEYQVDVFDVSEDEKGTVVHIEREEHA
jgi:SP family general alpha glucoside:H+ symporter-like MFS transporter